MAAQEQQICMVLPSKAEPGVQRQHAVRRYEHGQFRPLADTVVREARIELNINQGQTRLAMLCLPRDLDLLAIGFLIGEGALRSMNDLRNVIVDSSGKEVLVEGDFDAHALDMLSRRWTWGSGCGSGGTSRDLDRPAYQRVAEGTPVRPQDILNVFREFQSQQELWRSTGGVHACGLACQERLLAVTEDVGRHNAFDKLIGLCATQGFSLDDKYVITTGRLSAEIVSKAVANRVSTLASRCAATGLAIELAHRFGMTLVGFVRGERLNVYTGYHRIVDGSAQGCELDRGA